MEEIKAWLIAYESTYLSIDRAYPLVRIRWNWGNFLGFYIYLGFLVRFLEEFKVDLAPCKVVDIS